MISLYLSIAAILFAFLLMKKVHSNKISDKGVCAICEQVFADEELIEADDMYLCAPHLKLYVENEWEITKVIKCSPGNEEASVALYEEKLVNFNQQKFSYLRTSYEEVNGEIITTLSLFSIKKPYIT